MDRSYKLHGFTVSLLFHAGLLLLFFFFYLSTPNPPLSTFSGGGIELNFGELDAGTGDPSNLLPTNPEPATENLLAAAETENNESGDEINEDTEKDDINPVKDETAVPIKVEKEVKKNNATTVVEKKTTTTTTTTTTKTNEINKNAVMTKPADKKAGDDLDKAGNPGNPKGLDERASMKVGNPGFGGDGKGTGIGTEVGLDLNGWGFIGDPIPKEDTPESGELLYEIHVNADGEIIKIIPIENKGINPTTEKIYREHLRKMILDSKAGIKVPPLSKGTVRYRIKAK
jgi:periplasmic protein TonB